MTDLSAALSPRLQDLRRAGRYRSRRLRQGPMGPWVTLDGRRLLAFASNDYLGLAADPRLGQAMVRAAEAYGVGAGAAHLLGGHTAVHHALEEALAGFVGRPRALLFSTGYMANLGVVSTLCARGDVVLQDRLNHASLLDGARLSGARLLRYHHGDMDHLRHRLRQAGEAARLIATDAVFSMDGDLAPLASLHHLSREAGAWLLVDEAHGLGVLGPGGRGALAAQGVTDPQVIVMGTLGKALGTFGAFVAGPEALIETLIQDARSYLFTTAPPPAVAAATLAALEIVHREPERREQLSERVRQFRRGAAELGLVLVDSPTPIQPPMVGEDRRAVALSQALEEQGIWVPPVRPPTVPEGQARLRITLSAAHEAEHVDRLLAALDNVWRQL